MWYTVQLLDGSNVNSFEAESPEEAARLWAVDDVQWDVTADWDGTSSVVQVSHNGSDVGQFTVKPHVVATTEPFHG